MEISTPLNELSHKCRSWETSLHCSPSSLAQSILIWSTYTQTPKWNQTSLCLRQTNYKVHSNPLLFLIKYRNPLYRTTQSRMLIVNLLTNKILGRNSQTYFFISYHQWFFYMSQYILVDRRWIKYLNLWAFPKII